MKKIIKAFSKLFGGNTIVTSGNIFRDICVASAFGATAMTDNYFLAISVPVFMLTIASNSFRSIVVPLLISIKNRNSSELREITAYIEYSMLRFVALAVAIILIIYCCCYAMLSATQYVELGENHNQLFILAVAFLFVYGASAIIELNQGVFQVNGYYFWPTVAKVGLPAGTAIFGMYLANYLGVYALVMGGMIGVCASLAFIIIKLKKINKLLLSKESLISKEDLSRAKFGFWGLVAGTSIAYLNPLIDQWIIAILDLGRGAISQVNYSSRIIIGISSLIIGSVTPVLIAFLSDKTYRDSPQKMTLIIKLGLKLSCWVGCSGIFFTWILADYIANLLYGGRAMTEEGLGQIAIMLKSYSLQFPFFFAGAVPVAILSATSNNKYFVHIGIVMCVLNIGFDVVFMSIFRLPGVAYATALVYMSSAILMHYILKRLSIYNFTFSDLFYGVLPFLVTASGIYLYQEENYFILCAILIVAAALFAMLTNKALNTLREKA